MVLWVEEGNGSMGRVVDDAYWGFENPQNHEATEVKIMSRVGLWYQTVFLGQEILVVKEVKNLDEEIL